MCGLYLKRFKIMLATCASLLVVKIGYVMCGVSNFTMFKTPIACIALGHLGTTTSPSTHWHLFPQGLESLS